MIKKNGVYYAGKIALPKVLDDYDAEHMTRVPAIVVLMCEQINKIALAAGEKRVFSSADIENVRAAAEVFDVGMLKIPHKLLEKETITQGERVQIIHHIEHSRQMAKIAGYNSDVQSLILSHHELLDGTGPYGKSERDLSLLAQVLITADVFDDLVSSKTGQDGLTLDEALIAMGEAAQAGKLSSALVDILLKLRKQSKKFRDLYSLSSKKRLKKSIAAMKEDVIV
jgi:HD-GYP domain-containing protein (c-di-GMP phosphodiesterase class II)